MPRKKAAAKSEAEETTEVLDTKEPERPMSPNEGPAEIGQAGDEASCAGVLEPAGEEEPDAEAAVSQQDMSVADMLLPEENADSNAVRWNRICRRKSLPQKKYWPELYWRAVKTPSALKGWRLRARTMNRCRAGRMPHLQKNRNI